MPTLLALVFFCLVQSLVAQWVNTQGRIIKGIKQIQKTFRSFNALKLALCLVSIIILQLQSASLLQAQNYRVRFELIYNGKTTDASDPQYVFGNNTEDEIFFGVNASTVFNGKVSNSNHVIRPKSGRDIIEMGPNSNRSLNFSLFKGMIKPKEVVAFNLAIIEQDNAQVESFVRLGVGIGAALGAVVSVLVGEVGLAAALGEQAKSAIIDGTKALYKSLDEKKQQLIGDVMISVHDKGNGPALKVSSQNYSRVTRQAKNLVELALNGSKSNYKLLVYLEPASTPFKATEIYLDSSIDKCKCGKISVNGVSLAFGQTKNVNIGGDGNAYTWYCCDSDESANPPTGTNLIKVSYQRENKISWRWYNRINVSPIIRR